MSCTQCGRTTGLCQSSHVLLHVMVYALKSELRRSAQASNSLCPLEYSCMSSPNCRSLSCVGVHKLAGRKWSICAER